MTGDLNNIKIVKGIISPVVFLCYVDHYLKSITKRLIGSMATEYYVNTQQILINADSKFPADSFKVLVPLVLSVLRTEGDL